MLRTRTARLLLAIAAVFGVTAGAAYATGGLGAVVGGDGVIHGCYQRYNGDLHLVAADDAACPSGQLPVAWGQTGAKGDAGAPGTPGAPGVSGYELVHNDFTVAMDDRVEVSVTCPPGKVVVGGGVLALTTYGQDLVRRPVRVYDNGPLNATTWRARIDNVPATHEWPYRIQAICAAAG